MLYTSVPFFAKNITFVFLFINSFMVYVILILKVQSKVHVIVYTDVTVFSDVRFGWGQDLGLLQFS